MSRERAQSRYVVLHHTGFGEPHFDVMVESVPGSPLMTWRAPDWPPVAGDGLTRIGDHRRDYLEYEGPVSENRGEVRRVADGACELSNAADQVTLRIFGPPELLIILRRVRNDLWNVVEVSP